jgi:signal transduction histidine kinase
MRNLLGVIVLLAGLLAGMPLWAAGEATPDEAKAMAIKAAEYLKSAGPEQAFAAFDAKDGPWHDRDLYVVVQNSQGVMVAHGVNAGLIGHVVLDLKDVDGRPFNREMQAVQNADWVNYKWQNPTTRAVETKTMYVIREGEYLVGVGAYAR